MSAMLLCRNRRVRSPYYVEELGIHLYSGEELSYYIYHNAMLIGSDFFEERLFRFVGQELGMDKLEAKLRRWAAQAETAELLLVILQDIHYYNAAELGAFKKSLEELEHMTAAEKMKLRGDYLVKSRRYSAAMTQYDKLISGNYPEMRRAEFRGKTWQACGVVYARMFCWKQAVECLEKAWDDLREDEIRRMIYQILCQEPTADVRVDIMEDVPEETLQQWKYQMNEAREEARTSDRAQEVNRWLERDSLRRAEGLRSLTEEWKKAFRRNQGS